MSLLQAALSDLEASEKARKEKEEAAERTLSASQINAWLDCKRKWGWTYIAKLRAPPNGSAALGTKMHAMLEGYLRGGELDFTAPLNVADIAVQGLPFLPEPNAPGLEIETPFSFQSPETGIWYRGFVDVGVGPEFRIEEGRLGVPLILDHKSTSNLKWRKTPDDLREDVQSMMYAKNALLRWPEAQEVDLRWVYYQTRGKRVAEASEVTVTREHVEQMFPLIESSSKEIVATLSARTPPLDLPPTPASCEKYGGCPFRDKCNLSPKEILRAMTNASNPTTSFLSRLAGAAPAAPPPAPSGGLLGSLLKPSTTAPPTTPSTTAPAPASAYAPGCEPPAPADIPANLLPPMPKSDQPINPPEFQPAPPSGAAMLAAPPPSEEKPKGTRGRPKGSKNAPKDPTGADVAAHTQLPEEKAAQAIGTDGDNGSPTSDSQTVPATRTGWTLFVDCIPSDTFKVRAATSLIAQANKDICDKLGVQEWRIGEAVGFGKGAGYLSGRVAELAKELGEDIYLDSHTPEGAACKAALMSLTPNVVIGVGR